jgi:hypothetical protein
MPTSQQLARTRSTFAPRKYAVTFEDLKAWRAAGESTPQIASRFNCDITTVRHWLIRLGLPTANPLVKPNPAPPGGMPKTKHYAYEHELSARRKASLPKPKEAEA